METPTKPRKFGTRYPWEDWFSRRGGFTLVRGRDYACATHGMAAMVRNKASTHFRVRVKVTTDDDARRLTVSVLGPIPEPKEVRGAARQTRRS